MPKPNSSAANELLQRVRTQLHANAKPSKAAPMQAYMKSAMPYLGVPTPQLRAICRKVFAEIVLTDVDAWRDAVLQLWREAKYREERYAAIELTDFKPYRAFASPQLLPMYEELIVSGAWWDYVDSVSARLGDLLRTHPKEMSKAMRQWARSDHMWKRRAAIICQLHCKRATDLKLLYECIELAIDEREFFLRKAIGWALRQYAKTDPDEVLAYVRRNQARLSPLSKREALKGLLRKGRIREVP